MALRLHRAPRADQLAEALGTLLATPPADPFAQELVLVPARGVERWLSQRLSHRLGPRRRTDDGVCAGVEFRSPASPGRRGHRHRAERRPVGARRAGLAAARGGRRQRRRGVVPHARRRTSATGRPARRASSGAAGATPWPGGWPGCSRRTPCSGRGCSPTGRRASTATAPAAPLDPDLLWQPELWRRLVGGRRRAHARSCAMPACSRRCAPARRRSTCRRGSRCSATPGSR